MRGLLYLLSFCVLFFWSMAMLGAVTIGKVENEKSYKAILIGLICLIISLIFWMFNTELVHNKQIPENNEVEKDTIIEVTKDTIIEVTKIIEFIYSDGDTIRLEDKEFRLKGKEE